MREWAHSPSRQVCEAGTYIVTAGTYQRTRLFHGPERLTYLHGRLHFWAEELGWRLEAWAVFENHYHFVGHSPSSGTELEDFTRRLHGETSREINRLDQVAGLKVWMNYRQTRLTYSNSYLARLNYVHQNPVHHHLVRDACDYPWCSARWFEEKAEAAWRRTVEGFPIDRVNVPDDF